MNKIILFLLFFSFLFSKDSIEVKSKIITVENLANDEIISKVEKYFSGSSKAVQQGVKARFVKEKKKALELLKKEKKS